MSETPPTDPNYTKRLELIRALHQSPTRLVLATTGGGSLAISDLLSVPGGSKTVLEAIVPYTRAAIARFIARTPEQYCCARTARQLAMAAFQRGQYLLDADRQASNRSPKTAHYAEYDDPSGSLATGSPFGRRLNDDGDLEDDFDLIGVGCTASLVTDWAKKGEYRLHIATQTLQRTTTCSLQLMKGARTRWEEERLVADLILNMILNVKAPLPTIKPESAFPQRPPSDSGEESFGRPFLSGTSKDVTVEEILPLGLRDGEKILSRRTVASLPLVDLFFGKTQAVLWQGGEIRYYRLAKELPTPQKLVFNPQAEYTQAIFPGSFNPIHEAHRQMVEIAENRLGNRVALEIAVQIVDKPTLDFIDLEDRLTQIERLIPNQAVWLTQTKMFEEKAEFFKETMFVIGADTLRRFADLRFYNGNTHELQDVLRMIAYWNCRFLVFARQGENGLESLRTLEIPDMLRSLCDEIPPEEFAMNLSSSEIRRYEDDLD